MVITFTLKKVVFTPGLTMNYKQREMRTDSERYTSVLELDLIVVILDLQKAEAQAREAQIETALERVRSTNYGNA